mmetsp:Transcript_57705/g.125488  ORF Transcript_57705/g.125488 Transcript_57705/m.125488 type:complete len:432 (-) Transcript_57705:40-1335(-)
MAREFDLVVFGASGFTGAYVVKRLDETLTLENRTLRWAVAGRDERRTRNQISQVAPSLDAEALPFIWADTSAEASLSAMAARCTVLVNCTGPFRFHGEAVVSACIAQGTHYTDISGEPQFSETMALKHNSAAAVSGSAVVTTCGFDCIPAEIGVLYTGEQFVSPALPATVEAYISLHCDAPSLAGACHYTTWEALVHSIGNADELRKLRREHGATPTQQPKPAVRLARRSGVFYDDRVSAWCMPFMGADNAVVRASQAAFASRPDLGVTPVQFATYIRLPSLWVAMQFVFFGGFLLLLAKFHWGRSLLLKYPGFFSKGLVSRAGPTPQQLKATSFSMAFFGQGFRNESERTSADVAVSTSLSGPEPGYVATPIFVVRSTLALLDKVAKGTIRSGVMTPAVAFASESRALREALTRDGIEFKSVGSGSEPNV